MKLRRREFLGLAAGAAALSSAARVAKAQTYPSRPITLIIPFAAGGPTDTLARILADRMKDTLGQTIVIESVTGAGSTIGTTRLVQSAPDGYTLILGNWTSHVGAGALYPVKWNVLTDMEPIARLSESYLMIVGKNALPAKDAKELIAWLRANPGKASAATVGAGSGAHICALYFGQKTGTSFQFVPYRGGAPAVQDIVAGQIDLFCAEASQTLAQVRAGTIKAFSVMANARWAPLPDVPTMEEVGVSGMQIPFWHGLWAPKHTPQDIIAKVNAAVIAAFADPNIQKRIAELGQVIPRREEMTPAALAAFHKSEIDKWWPVIRAANIQVN